MANKIFYQEDCNLGLLDGKTIAISDLYGKSKPLGNTFYF